MFLAKLPFSLFAPSFLPLLEKIPSLFWTLLTERDCCQTLASVGTYRERCRLRCRSFRPEVAAHSPHTSLTLHLKLSTLHTSLTLSTLDLSISNTNTALLGLRPGHFTFCLQLFGRLWANIWVVIQKYIWIYSYKKPWLGVEGPYTI